MKALVSIVIPMYNSEKYISDTIESVLKQSYKNFEVIIVDDCSEDMSVEIVKKFEAQDNRIKLITMNQNRGQAIARNKGIELAQGKYLTFIDSDDLWLKTYLEEQVIFISEMNADIVFSSYKRMNEDLSEDLGDFIVPSKVNYNKLLKTNYLSCLTTLIDIENIGKFYFNDTMTMHEDYVMWLEILKTVKFAYGNKSKLAIYRVRNNSVSRNKFKGIQKIWHIYKNVEKLSFIKRLYTILIYSFNGFNKNYRFILKK